MLPLIVPALLSVWSDPVPAVLEMAKAVGSATKTLPVLPMFIVAEPWLALLMPVAEVPVADTGALTSMVALAASSIEMPSALLPVAETDPFDVIDTLPPRAYPLMLSAPSPVVETAAFDVIDTSPKPLCTPRIP